MFNDLKRPDGSWDTDGIIAVSIVALCYPIAIIGAALVLYAIAWGFN